MRFLLVLALVSLLAGACQTSTEDAYNSGADLNAHRFKELVEEARVQCDLAVAHREALRAKYISDESAPVPDAEIEPFWMQATTLQLGVCRLRDKVDKAEELAWNEQERRLGHNAYLRMLEAE